LFSMDYWSGSTRSTTVISPEKKAEKLNAIDREGQDYMIHAEKNCRKIKKLPNTILTRSIYLDSEGAGLLLDHPMVQGENPKTKEILNGRQDNVTYQTH
jgi:hypothetical protein